MNPLALLALFSLLGLGLGGGKIGEKLDEVNKRNALKPTPSPMPTPRWDETAIGKLLSGYSKPTNTPTPSPTIAPSATPTPSLMPTSTPRPGSIAGYINGPIPGQDIPRINKYSTQHNVPPALLASGLMTESGFNPRAQNAGDFGEAQINLASHPQVTEQQAYDPDFATNFMAEYLAREYARRKNWAQAIAAYNVGPGRVGEGYGPTGVGPKGTQYLEKIKRNLDPSILQQLGLQ